MCGVWLGLGWGWGAEQGDHQREGLLTAVAQRFRPSNGPCVNFLGLTQQNLILAQFWKLGVQHQGAGRAGLSRSWVEEPFLASPSSWRPRRPWLVAASLVLCLIFTCLSFVSAANPLFSL